MLPATLTELENTSPAQETVSLYHRTQHQVSIAIHAHQGVSPCRQRKRLRQSQTPHSQGRIVVLFNPIQANDLMQGAPATDTSQGPGLSSNLIELTAAHA